MNGLQVHSNDGPPLSSTAVSDALANIGQVAQVLLQSGLVPVQDVSGAGGGDGSLPDQFHGLGHHTGLGHRPQSDTESDGELDDFAEENAGHRLTTASVDAQATKSDEAWTPEEEEELVKLVAHEEYRKVRLGDTTTKWAPIAAHFSRTVKAVKRKFDKLQNPSKEHRKSRNARTGGSNGAVMGLSGANPYLPLVGQMAPPTSELLAGLYMGDANAMAVAGLAQYPGAGSLPHGLTAEQAAALQGAVLGGAGAGVAPAMTAEALSAYLGQAFPGQAVPGYGGLYDGSGAADGGAAAAVGLMGLPPGYSDALLAQLQYASPAGGYGGGAALLGGGAGAGGVGAHHGVGHHHALSGGVSGGLGSVGGGGGAPGVPAPHHDRRFWNESDQQELLRLAGDAQYRQALLGTAELNWDLIARQLGRGKRSVQRKYDNLKGTSLPTAGGGSILPINDGKKWSTEEVGELLRLVEDADYRKETLGLDKVEWRALGQHFGRSYESVSYKYSYVKNTGRMETKTKHAKAKHETSYKEMAVWALSQLPNGDGTSGQICAVITTNPLFAPQLDTAIVSGKKTLQRWKHGVRSALNAFSMFVKTGAVRDGEVVWRLDGDALAAEQAAHAEKAARQRNKPLSGAQRRKLKKQAAAAAAAASAAGAVLPQLLATPAHFAPDAARHHELPGVAEAGYGYADASGGLPTTNNGMPDAVARSEEGAHEALARMAQQGRGGADESGRRRGRAEGDDGGAPSAKRFDAGADYAKAAAGYHARDAGAPAHEALPPELQVPLLQMMQSEPLSAEQMQSLLSAQLASGVPLHLLGAGDAGAAAGGYYSAGGAGQGAGAYATDYDAAAAAAAAAYNDYYGAAGGAAGAAGGFGAAELAALQVMPHDAAASLGLTGGAGAGQSDAYALGPGAQLTADQAGGPGAPGGPPAYASAFDHRPRHDA